MRITIDNSFRPLSRLINSSIERLMCLELDGAEEVLNYGLASEKQVKLAGEILRFLATANGLKSTVVDECRIRILQTMDGKVVCLSIQDLDEVLERSDVSGEDFLQVNMKTGSKMLLTKTLIGFKPCVPAGLDSTRIPRVVTTPDVINVFEAIQDAVHSTGSASHEVALLKKVYEAVLNGGEAVGFNLAEERSWLNRIISNQAKFTA